MDRVTTFGAYNSVITSLMGAEVRQNQAQVQVSSGKVAQDLKGFGASAEALTAAQTLKTRVDGFVEGAKGLSSKLDAQNLALTQVSDAAQGARQAIANAVATGRADGLMEALQSYFTGATSGLNTQYNGHYLFAGGRVDTPPVAAQTLSDLVTPPPSGVFQNDQLATASRLDESTTIQSGMLASDVGTGLFNALAQIKTFDQGAGGPFTGQLTQAQSDYLTSMLSTFDTASQGLTAQVAQNGFMQNRVDQTLATQKDRQTVLEVMIGNITDVDVAEAASRLSQAQVALQASAHIFASLQNSSLLNYLSGTGG
jgi:flagellar hook-associated protein 3 FlgL